MKQLLQELRSGETYITDVPRPQVKNGHVLVQTKATLISPGTERMLRAFGKGNLISKAMQQPDRVRQAVQKMGTDGIVPTYQAIANKLDDAIALGYCNVGKIIEVGANSKWRVGERVVSNGAHAEYVQVPSTLCAKVPEDVTDDEACFAVPGAIAMQAIRLAKPNIGETIVVIGLGLIGLLTAQILKANGCRVIGVDIKSERIALADGLDLDRIIDPQTEDVVDAMFAETNGVGVDAVVIAASSESQSIISQAAQMSRRRGRVILLGVVGLNLARSDFYEKEISFQVSCSYGPGRYDPQYEAGQDYPHGFVRWTAQRNMEAVLELIRRKSLNVHDLISHRFSLSEFSNAYELIEGEAQALGILFEYNAEDEKKSQTSALQTIRMRQIKSKETVPTVGFIGAGNHTHVKLAPAFQKAEATLHTVVSETGLSAHKLAGKFGFGYASSNINSVLENDEIDLVVIATRHDSHAELICKALQHGKHVFVEKPLALTGSQIRQIEKCLSTQRDEGSPLLMVGFNRRFAPIIQKIKPILEVASKPKSLVITVNAGKISDDHWTQNPNIGGGRIIGEACHFIDLLRFLVGHTIEHITATSMAAECDDTLTITLTFSDGSIGTIHYFANGNRKVPKERLEIYCNGKTLQVENFKRLKSYGWPGIRNKRLLIQDKGHNQCVSAFFDALAKGSVPPIPINEILEVSRAAISVNERARERCLK